jgi:hypothetical protein
MKQLLGRFGVGLALLLASLTNQGLAANQVKGTAQGTTWQAMSTTAPAVAIDNNGNPRRHITCEQKHLDTTWKLRRRRGSGGRHGLDRGDQRLSVAGL